MNFSTTTVPVELHRLPGFGDLEYIYSQMLKELTINCNGRELMAFKGEEAAMIYNQLVFAGEFKTPEEIKVDAMLRTAFNVSMEQVATRSRERTIVEYRYLGMWWMANNSSMDHALIGKLFGGFDHATVSYANRTVNNLVETNGEFRGLVKRFLNAENQ